MKLTVQIRPQCEVNYPPDDGGSNYQLEMDGDEYLMTYEWYGTFRSFVFNRQDLAKINEAVNEYQLMMQRIGGSDER